MDEGSVQSRGTSLVVWLATIALGFGYWLGALGRSGVAFQDLAGLSDAVLVPWKGACTLGLALSLALAGRGVPLRLLAFALTISAVADMLLSTGAMVLSGGLFSVSHVIVIAVFWRNRASDLSITRRVVALAVPVLAFSLSVLALYGTGQPMVFAIYPLLSGIMATAAILSRYPVWLCGLGAATFVCSDVLVLAWMGVFERDNSLNYLTWLSYFGGYALLVRGALLAASNQARMHREISHAQTRPR